MIRLSATNQLDVEFSNDIPSHILYVHFDMRSNVIYRIDRELYRLEHHKEYEIEQFEEEKPQVVDKILHEELFMHLQEDETENLMQMRKDKRLAERHPDLYCADRCLTTGNCDVFEDFFELSATEVLRFCEECVLSDDVEKPCDINDKTMDKYANGNMVNGYSVNGNSANGSTLQP